MFLYPQLYNDQSSSSSNKIAYMQSITADDSCLPFDDLYASWYSVSAYSEANPTDMTLVGGEANVNYNQEYVYRIRWDERYVEDYSAYKSSDQLWCPQSNAAVVLSPSLADQSWYPTDGFSYTFAEWSASCDDLRVDYKEVYLYRKVYGSYEDASAYLSFDTDTRTVAGLTTPAIDDEFLVRIEGFANDGKCTQSSFTITNPCVANALSVTSNGKADQTYYLTDSALTIYPSTFLSTTVSAATCPLTYSYYIWSDS